jgi:hypothetical protein
MLALKRSGVKINWSEIATKAFQEAIQKIDEGDLSVTKKGKFQQMDRQHGKGK